MSETRFTAEPTGLDRFARFDPSISRARIAGHVHNPEWFGAYIWCLRHMDYEAAEVILKRNRREVAGK